MTSLPTRTQASLAVLLSLASTAPAAGTDRAGLLDALDPRARPAIGQTIQRVEDLRRAIADGRANTLAALQGDASAFLSTAQPSAAGPRQALAELTAAVDAAVRMLGRRAPEEIAAAVSAMRGTATGRAETLGGSRQAPGTPGVAIPAPLGTVQLPPATANAAALAPQVSLLIARALDRALPVLRRAVPRASGEAAAACDVMDQAPALCVSSEADNANTKEAALVVDLGGDDTYTTGAGGAPFPPPGSSAYVPVSVTVDLGGNDTYTASKLPGWVSWDVAIAQGAAAPGAVGILVDESGDDRYTVRAPVPSPGKQTVVAAQGASLGGVGALFDGGGDDTYSVVADDGAYSVSSFVQGAAFQCPGAVTNQLSPAHAGAGCATGVLVDRGQGDDTYVADGGTVSLTKANPSRGRVVYAQAAAGFGDALLSDGGGTDSFRVVASGRREDTLTAPTSGIASVSVYGQGSVIAGNAYLLEGHGETRYELVAESHGAASNSVWGQGFAAGGIPTGMNNGDAISVVDDRGGDDTYLAGSSLRHAPEIVIDDQSCKQDAGGCERAEAAVDLHGSIGSMVHVQAAGGFTSRATLRDRGGDDSYSAFNDLALDVTLTDRLSAPTAPPLLDVKTYKDTWIYAQGWSLCSGKSLLADEEGTDTYDLHASTDVSARATSAHAAGEPEVTALSGTKLAYGQGSGLTGLVCSTDAMLPALVDLGGRNDRFTASATGTASTAPNTEGALQEGCCWPAFQGGVGGTFVADGDDPVILSSPNQGVCPLSPSVARGFGHWMNCQTQGTDPEHQTYERVWIYPSTGRAPGAIGVAPTLTLLPETPASAVSEGRIEVAARLLNASGQPIAGAPITFDLQYQFADAFFVEFGKAWANVWEVAGVTNGDGIARARLPVTNQKWNHYGKNFYSLSLTAPWQILATYDGDAGIYPRHASQPIALTQP